MIKNENGTDICLRGSRCVKEFKEEHNNNNERW